MTTCMFAMPHRLFALACVVLAAALCGGQSPDPAEADWGAKRGNSLVKPVAHSLIVRVARPEWADEMAARVGGAVTYRFASDPSVVEIAWNDWRAANERWAFGAASQLRGHWSVEWVQVSPEHVRVQHQFAPADTYFPPNTPAAPWPGQWYLTNGGVASWDLRVDAAWLANRTGTGVVVGVVDDGLQTAHPDLSANMASAEHRDFVQADNDPNPGGANDNHGTAVAGLIAARGGNNLGITGAAPRAGLAGLRVGFPGTAAMFSDATLYRSSGATRTITVKNHSYGPSTPFASATVESNALTTSAQAGTIHVWSAGNARGSALQDANKSMTTANPWALVVAATGSDGRFAEYSSFGANVVCAAPSFSLNQKLVLTTDRTGSANGYNGATGDAFPDPDYTSTFTGTSASAALASGVMALLKQVKPAADVRFAKHLLALTARRIDPTDATESSDGGWKTNGAGIAFNQNYGFGLMDASALVAEAANWGGVSALATATSGTVNVNAAIPDNNATGLTRTFSLTGTGKLEEMTLRLVATHPYRGDLQATITSPSGTTSRLFARSGNDDGVNLDWTFATHAFWGESVAGTWTIRLSDLGPEDAGTWTSFNATARLGQLLPATFPVSGNITLGSFSGTVSGTPVVFQLRTPGTSTVVATFNATLGTAGAFSFPSTLSGTYDVACKASHWLRERLSNVVIGTSGVSGLALTLRNGDVNGDNTVNVSDFLALRAAFGSTSSSGNWNANADLDGNGSVGVSDFLVLRAAFGQSGV